MNSAMRMRKLIASGQPAVGSFIKLPSTEIVDLSISAGLDFVVADYEHSQLEEQAVRNLARHAHAAGFPLLVRIPEVDKGLINRLLEAGAAGIQLSMLRSVAQRDAFVSSTRYAPLGVRSISLAHGPAGYGAEGINTYLEQMAAHPPLLVGQIETATTDDPLDDVVAGLDVAFVGTTDMSVDMGHPGDVDNARVQTRIADVAAAAERAGVSFGGWAAGPAEATALRANKAAYLLVGSDLQMMRGALGSLAESVRDAFD